MWRKFQVRRKSHCSITAAAICTASGPAFSGIAPGTISSFANPSILSLTGIASSLNRYVVVFPLGEHHLSNFIQVTPFMHVHDLGQAINFFTETLGFETLFRAANYAYIEQEGVGFVSRSKPAMTERLPVIDVSPITSTFTMSISSIRNSNQSSTPCQKAMSTGQ